MNPQFSLRIVSFLRPVDGNAVASIGRLVVFIPSLNYQHMAEIKCHLHARTS
jgi:hypothetical protein